MFCEVLHTSPVSLRHFALVAGLLKEDWLAEVMGKRWLFVQHCMKCLFGLHSIHDRLILPSQKIAHKVFCPGYGVYFQEDALVMGL